MNTTNQSTDETPRHPDLTHALQSLAAQPPPLAQVIQRRVEECFSDANRPTHSPAAALNFDRNKARFINDQIAQNTPRAKSPPSTPNPPQPPSPQQPPPVYTPEPNPSQTRTDPDPHPTSARPAPAPGSPSFLDPFGMFGAPDPDSAAEFAAYLTQCKANETARIQEEIAESMNPLSEFDRLPDHQQKIIYDLLNEFSHEKVRAVLNQPAPAGWGLTSALASNKRFKKRYKTRDVAKRKARSARLAADVLSDKSATDADIDQASQQILQIRILEAVNDPETKIRDLRDLFQIQTRLRQLAIAQQRLQLSRSSRREEAHSNSIATPTHTV